MLSPEARSLWEAYLDQERQHVRSEMLRALERFIRALDRLPLGDRASWALTIAEDVVDHKKQTPVRLPLFREVLFPVLLSGHQKQMPGCARWLAGFAQLLYNSRECLDQLGPDERSELALLRAALRLDPNDSRARKQLVRVVAAHLEYAIHEVPSGVLFGMDGATVAECDELLEELAEFSRLTDADGSIEQYRDLIDDCGLHFVAYREFLRNRSQYIDYANYLEQIADS